MPPSQLPTRLCLSNAYKASSYHDVEEDQDQDPKNPHIVDIVVSPMASSERMQPPASGHDRPYSKDATLFNLPGDFSGLAGVKPCSAFLTDEAASRLRDTTPRNHSLSREWEGCGYASGCSAEEGQDAAVACLVLGKNRMRDLPNVLACKPT
ncbi:hypothetical protein FGG08_004134 [Glutinoglossum americanum]|uniref:Uncharacterized protein n=1 Tax=Glutinoglossum americanum TaxID=1670608 RepID=A0A9P8KZV7_9PEZI|nr:hypothetical protein FGG08_004134 [Glutinoglossum americanum]